MSGSVTEVAGSTPPDDGVAASRQHRGYSQEQIVLGVALALVVVLSLAVDGFFTVENLLTLARNVSALGILGIGLAIVVIGRGLDLSLVASMGVATALTLQVVGGGWSLASALMLGVAIVVTVGIVNGLLIAFVEIPPLFTTLATGLFVYGLARTIWLEGLIIELPSQAAFIRFLGAGRVLGVVPMPILVFALVAVTVHVFMSRVSVGRFIYAHGDNAEAAALSGVPIRPLTVLEYTLSALIGLIAGLVLAGSVNGFNTQTIDSSLIYDVLLVVVVGGISLVGGRGSVFSVVVGTALIGVMLNGMTLLDFSVYQQNITKGLILLAALVLDNRLHPRDEETVRQGD